MTRVLAAAGLGLTWFVLVATGALMAGHSDTGLSVVVLIVLVGPFLGGFLLVQASEDLDGAGLAMLWVAWSVAAVLGMIAMAGGKVAYEPWFGHPEAVIVMGTQCLPDSEADACDPQVRVSTAATERDLGWLMDCDPLHAPGQEAVVLVDPHHWFQPQVSTCAGNGRSLGLFIVGSAGGVAALTVTQVTSLAWLAVRSSRRTRRRDADRALAKLR